MDTHTIATTNTSQSLEVDGILDVRVRTVPVRMTVTESKDEFLSRAPKNVGWSCTGGTTKINDNSHK